jgi:iron complex transport system substrate-binding protein
VQRFIIFIFISFIVVGISSCESKKATAEIESVFNAIPESSWKSRVKYAKGFDLYDAGHLKKLVIYHPEMNGDIISTFYLIDSLEMDKNNYQKSENVILLPMSDVAVFSATQLNAIEMLGLLDEVKGVSEARYINSKAVRAKLEAGEIVELATNADYFIEKILSVNPSLIFYSPFQFIEQHPLEKTGIPLVSFYDYFENEPLGRAEWIKFTATFFNKDEAADELFRQIEANYLAYKKLTDSLRNKPSVFSDKYFNGQWYVPGGKSYIAALFRDAGANYIWKNDNHTGSFPLDYEVVYSKAHHADFWRIVGSYGDEPTYEALASENELYKNFKAFQTKKVIWCDAEETAYFENSPLEPHQVLADLIFVFHPELLPDHQPKYYHILK